MRTLRFNVNGQKIILDPSCDTTTLIPGTESYVQAEFTFSSEWDKWPRVVGFYSNLGVEYEAQTLKDGKLCTIPAEALKKRIFKVKVFGKRNGYDICTNKLTLYKRGGNL